MQSDQNTDREDLTDVDVRFRDVLNTDTVFDPPMPVYESLAQWEERRKDLRLHVLTAAGLLPTPDKAPLNVRRTARHECRGFVVENLYFESLPGFFVTGNLYSPTSGVGPFPGIACPHGHWSEGRLAMDESGSVPARCVALARMGNVVFAYDMVGYNDSLQMAHRFEGAREYLYGLSVLGLQLWNSIRVLDLLQSLGNVDPDRLGCTGASGGGTQTFLLTAIDDRVAVSAPVNMVSAHMQGGCVCENAPHLRLDATNVEIAAMMAPRPMILISATGDWTTNTPTAEFPAIRHIYELYGVPADLHHVQIDAGHNYNADSRRAVYPWLMRWLHGASGDVGIDENVDDLPPPAGLRVFPDGLPEIALSGNRLLETLVTQARGRTMAMLETEDVSSAPTGGDTWTVFRHVVNATRPRRIQTASEPREPGVEKLLLKPEGVVGPVAALSVRGGDVRQSTVVVVAPEGKDVCLVDEPLVQALLQGGYAVILLDAFGTGESVTFAREEERHFLTFNRTDLANRVQDVVTTTTHALGSAKAVDLVGVRQSGLWALLARPYLPDVRVTVCDMGNTNYDDDEAFTGEDRLPGVRQFGGVAGAGTLIAPGVLHLHGLAAGWDLTPLRRAYDATGSGRHLSTSQSAASTDEILARLR